MPTVLWLCEYAELHGAEHSLLANLPFVREAGYELIACAPPDGPLAEALQGAGVGVLPLPPLVAKSEAARDQRRDALRRLIERAKPQLVHANSLAMARLSGPVVARLAVASVAHLRDIVGLSRAAVDDVNRHTRLLAVSRATARFHSAQGIARSKLYTLYNGVDVSRFAPCAPSGWLCRQWALPPAAVLLGTIGQVGLRKGHDVLFDALIDVVREYPAAHLLVVGARTSEKDESRRFEGELRARASRPPLAGHVHWLGITREVPALLAELALVVHPARQEPLGRVLLEAAACGRAIVATDVGGTGEIFTPRSRSARLVPAGDAEALASAIRDVLRDANQRRDLGRAARRRVEQRFDIHRTARGLVRHYDALCRSQRLAP